MSSSPIPFHMHRTGWFLLAICALIGVEIEGPSLGLPFAVFLLVSLLLHETGHMLAARALWVPVHEFGLTMGGAYNRRAFARRRRDEILISAAGPMMNLCVAVPCLFVPQIGTQLAMGNVALCVVNLLPIPASDGSRILRTLRQAGAPGAA